MCQAEHQVTHLVVQQPVNLHSLPCHPALVRRLHLCCSLPYVCVYNHRRSQCSAAYHRGGETVGRAAFLQENLNQGFAPWQRQLQCWLMPAVCCVLLLLPDPEAAGSLSCSVLYCVAAVQYELCAVVSTPG